MAALPRELNVSLYNEPELGFRNKYPEFDTGECARRLRPRLRSKLRD